MRAIVTVFKIEFLGQDNILKKAELMAETKDIGEAIILIPLPGKLFELLNLLKDNRINYGTHFKGEWPGH